MQGSSRDGAQYASADVLLFDATPPHRGTTRAALSMVGFKRITATSDLDEVVQCITQRAFDVVIADLTGNAQAVCDQRIGGEQAANAASNDHDIRGRCHPLAYRSVVAP